MEMTAGAILSLFLCFLLVSLVRAYTMHVKRQREATASIARFHTMLNAGEFDKICDETSLCIDLENSGAICGAFFQDVRDHAGKFRRVNKSEIKVYSEPAMASVTYFSSFEKENLKETFLLMGSGDGVFRVRDYTPEHKITEWSPLTHNPGCARATEAAEDWEEAHFLEPPRAMFSWIFPQ
jgi:hypothetical protein